MTGVYVYTADIWLPLGGAAFLIALTAYSWRRRRVPGAVPFAIASLFGAFWLLLLALEASAADPAIRVLWFKAQAGLKLPTIVASFCFAVEYARPGRWLTPRNVALLSLPAVVALFLIAAKDSALMWTYVGVTAAGMVEPRFAPAGVLAVSLAILYLLATVATFAWLLVRSPQNRWPVALMLLGGIVASGLQAPGLLHVSSAIRPDAGVIGILLGWAAYGVALFGFRILDPLPAARAAALERMQDGLLVLDANGNIASLNRAAVAILGVSAQRARGRPPGEFLPLQGDPAAGDALASGEIRLGAESDARYYSLERSALNDFRGLPLGHLLLLRDVTEQKRVHARLVEQQRAAAVLAERERLARELHDDLGQVLGYVKMQARAARNQLAQDQPAAADESLRQLIAVAQEAHADVREYVFGANLGPHLGAGAQGAGRDFLPALEAYVQRFGASNGVRAEWTCETGLNSEAFEPMVQAQLARIVQEALTNVRKHAGARCVRVSVEREGNGARVTVEDDGAGFDPAAWEGGAPKPGAEDATPGHFGLRFMADRVREVGGRMTVASGPGAGTKVVVQVPLGADRGGADVAPRGQRGLASPGQRGLRA